MKKLSIVGGILFVLGMLVATGIDLNPIQGVYSLVLLGASLACFSLADHDAESESENAKSVKHVDKKAA